VEANSDHGRLAAFETRANNLPIFELCAARFNFVDAPTDFLTPGSGRFGVVGLHAVDQLMCIARTVVRGERQCVFEDAGGVWRKQSFGSQSARGNVFAENLMTVAHTARKQKKNVLAFLVDCCRARLDGSSSPSLFGSNTALAA